MDTISMTALYQDIAKNDKMTAENAVAFLEKEAKGRTFAEMLKRVGAPDHAEALLVDGLKRMNPNLAKGSAEKRVKGWFQGKHLLKKADAIEVCFLLQLPFDKADQLIAMLSDESLHWRDPEELVFGFALLHGYDLERAKALISRLSSLFAKPENSKVQKRNVYTALIRNKVFEIQTEEELETFLRNSLEDLGSLHNTAYALFESRLKMLETPEPLYKGREEDRFTIRDILREYMFGNNVLYAKEIARMTRKGMLSEEYGKMLSTIQKEVSAGWPDETTISKMRTGQADVTRKALILLLMATEKGFQKIDSETDEEDDEYIPTKDEVFEDIYRRMNLTLKSCGFRELDPRSAFDWMILYSIYVQDMFDADRKMRELFRTMFGERPEADGN